MTTLGLLGEIQSTDHIALPPIVFFELSTRAPNVRPVLYGSLNTGDATDEPPFLLLSIRHNVDLNTTVNASNGSISAKFVIGGAVIAEFVCLSFVLKVMATPAASQVDSSITLLVLEIRAVTLPYNSCAPDGVAATPASKIMVRSESESTPQSCGSYGNKKGEA